MSSLQDLLDAIDATSQDPNPYDKYGKLQTVKPEYDVTKPGYTPDNELVPDLGNKIRTPLSSAGKVEKFKPLSRMELQAIQGSEAHDKETKNIAKLLSDYDNASRESNSRRMNAGITEAGMEFGHAFGGQPVDQEYMRRQNDAADLPRKDFLAKNNLRNTEMDQGRKNRKSDMDLLSEAQKQDLENTVIDKNQMTNDQTKRRMDPNSPASTFGRGLADKLGYSNNEDPNTTNEDILGNEKLINHDQDQIKAQRHEQESNKRTNQIVAGAYQRNKEDNGTQLAKEIMSTQTRENVSGMNGGTQRMKIANAMIPHLKIIRSEDGFIPGAKATESARELAGDYHAVMPIMAGAIQRLTSNPRQFFGSSDWNKTKSDLASAANKLNRLNRNGVVNGKDWEHIFQEIGDPDSFNQWLNQGGLTRLVQAFKNTDKAYGSRLGYLGYEEGEQDPQEIFDHLNGGSGGSGSGGNDLHGTQEALDSALQASGTGITAPMRGKTATNHGPQAPVAEPSSKVDQLRKKLALIKGTK